jgi:tRNA(fMet)-specific endonuclease VapC
VSTRFLLDTNIVSDLVRNPQGRAAARIASIGEAAVATSLIVAAELRYGAAKKASARLTAQLEQVLGALEVIALDVPADRQYGDVRSRLEAAGTPIGGNDLLIAAHAIVLDMTLVTDNVRAFGHVAGLRVENWLR